MTTEARAYYWEPAPFLVVNSNLLERELDWPWLCEDLVNLAIIKHVNIKFVTCLGYCLQRPEESSKNYCCFHFLNSRAVFESPFLLTSWIFSFELIEVQYLGLRFLFVQYISIPLISTLTYLQIIKFYVLIQVLEDKTEVLQSSLCRLNSGKNVNKLVDVICFSWIFNFIALVFFRKPLLYLRVPGND